LNKNSIKFDLGYFAEDQSDELDDYNFELFLARIGGNQSWAGILIG
jgi:hypothetical protein